MKDLKDLFEIIQLVAILILIIWVFNAYLGTKESFGELTKAEKSAKYLTDEVINFLTEE